MGSCGFGSQPLRDAQPAPGSNLFSQPAAASGWDWSRMDLEHRNLGSSERLAEPERIADSPEDARSVSQQRPQLRETLDQAWIVFERAGVEPVRRIRKLGERGRHSLRERRNEVMGADRSQVEVAKPVGRKNFDARSRCRGHGRPGTRANNQEFQLAAGELYSAEGVVSSRLILAIEFGAEQAVWVPGAGPRQDCENCIAYPHNDLVAYTRREKISCRCLLAKHSAAKGTKSRTSIC